MTLIDHPDWPKLLPWLKLEPTFQSRWRIELHVPADRALMQTINRIRCTCAHCDGRMKPVMMRKSWRTRYVRTTCGSNSCRNSRAARALAKQIHEAIRGTPRAWQGRLLDMMEGSDAPATAQ